MDSRRVCHGLAVVSVWAGLPVGALLAHLQQYLFFIIWVISNVFFFFCHSDVLVPLQQLYIPGIEYAAYPRDNRMPDAFNEKDNYVVLIIIVIFYLPVLPII